VLLREQFQLLEHLQQTSELKYWQADPAPALNAYKEAETAQHAGNLAAAAARHARVKTGTGPAAAVQVHVVENHPAAAQARVAGRHGTGKLPRADHHRATRPSAWMAPACGSPRHEPAQAQLAQLLAVQSPRQEQAWRSCCMAARSPGRSHASEQCDRRAARVAAEVKPPGDVRVRHLHHGQQAKEKHVQYP
jgi:hypothetical protein